MIAQPYWITSRIAIVPRPRGGDWLDDEMLALRSAGIDVVVSMLETKEAAELGLQRESDAAKLAGIVFVNFPVRDRGVPSDREAFIDLLALLEEHIASGRKVGIHCRACIGRSSVVAVSLLIRSKAPAEYSWLRVAAARGYPVPDTVEQREWVDRNVRSRL